MFQTSEVVFVNFSKPFIYDLYNKNALFTFFFNFSEEEKVEEEEIIIEEEEQIKLGMLFNMNLKREDYDIDKKQ